MGELGQTLTVLTPIYDKPEDVFRAHLDSIAAQGPDEQVIVFDRSPEGLRAMVNPMAKVVALDGPKGWRSPCYSFNAGLELVTGDITLLCHPDIVLAPGSMDFVRSSMAQKPAAYYGAVYESDMSKFGRGWAGPVLCSSVNSRPLAYLVAVPTIALRNVGGWDPAFQEGVCFEDDDLAARLWKHGLDFVFDDRLSGMHQSHERAYFSEIRFNSNLAHMLRKHGAREIWSRQAAQKKLIIVREPSRTTWRHP